MDQILYATFMLLASFVAVGLVLLAVLFAIKIYRGY